MLNTFHCFWTVIIYLCCPLYLLSSILHGRSMNDMERCIIDPLGELPKPLISEMMLGCPFGALCVYVISSALMITLITCVTMLCCWNREVKIKKNL